MARPRIEINVEELDKLLSLQCTLEELASWFKCSEDTIERFIKRRFKLDFADYSRQKRGVGKISLRRTMWQAALKGDRVMLIWLSKQHLAMADKVEQKTEVKGDLKEIVYVTEWGSAQEGPDQGEA